MKQSHTLSKALFGAFLASALCVTGHAATVESPVGVFDFETPAVPPAAPYPITEMAYLAGSYVNNPYTYLGATVDLAMDESGKVLAMGVLPGFKSKKDVKAGTTTDSQNARTLYVRTINGEPVLTANATASGEYDADANPSTDDSATKGTAQADIHLGVFPPITNPNYQVVPVMSSFKGNLDTDKSKEKPTMTYLYLDPTQVKALAKKTWEMRLVISQVPDSRTAAVSPTTLQYVAALSLIKPDGTQVRFPQRRVTYSSRLGYTIPFSNGTVYNGTQPVLDSNGRPVKDPTATVKFNNLTFRKDFTSGTPYFTPVGGVIDYAFFGQKGFGQTFNFRVTDVR